MGKKSILKEIEELKSDWKAVGDLSDSIFETAKSLVFNRDDLNESDIPDLEQVLALTDDLKKKMNQMYDEFRAAFVTNDLVKSDANDKEGSFKKDP